MNHSRPQQSTWCCQWQRTTDRPYRTAEEPRAARLLEAANGYTMTPLRIALRVCSRTQSRLRVQAWTRFCVAWPRETAGEHVFRAPCAGPEGGTLAFSIMESRSHRDARVTKAVDPAATDREVSSVHALRHPEKLSLGPSAIMTGMIPVGRGQPWPNCNDGCKGPAKPLSAAHPFRGASKAGRRDRRGLARGVRGRARGPRASLSRSIIVGPLCDARQGGHVRGATGHTATLQPSCAARLENCRQWSSL